MSREKEFDKVKKIIKENFSDANCGLYNTRNWTGDSMNTLFAGKYFQLDICYYWAYYEVFGTTKEEYEELEKIYNSMDERIDD